MPQLTPERQAEQLIQKFIEPTQDWDEFKGKWEDSEDKAKECAIIAVDEILIIMKEEYLSGAEKIEYWQKVREKISKLYQ